jgi:hypothetical protein
MMKNKHTTHSVTGFIAVAVILILTTLPTYAAQTSFSWLPSTEADLAGYKIHYGLSSGNYTTVIDVGNPPIQNDSILATIFDLEDDTTYFAVATSYDAEGLESPFTDEITWTTPAPPIVAPPIPTIISIH